MNKLHEWIGMCVAAGLLGSVTARAEPPACALQAQYTLAVHGGYVGEARPDWPDAAVKELTRQIVARGRERLARGDAALDVVVESIRTFETRDRPMRARDRSRIPPASSRPMLR